MEKNETMTFAPYFWGLIALNLALALLVFLLFIFYLSQSSGSIKLVDAVSSSTLGLAKSRVTSPVADPEGPVATVTEKP